MKMQELPNDVSTPQLIISWIVFVVAWLTNQAIGEISNVVELGIKVLTALSLLFLVIINGQRAIQIILSIIRKSPPKDEKR